MREIQSLARGLKILELLSQSLHGASITELAEKLAIDKSSASRLASTLSKYGYAYKNPETRRYQLGPRIIALSRNKLAALPLRQTAKPYLRQLMENTGECAHLAVLAQGKALCIDQEESSATLRVNVQVGQSLPLHCTALGKVLLAYHEREMPETLEQYTPRTLLDFDELQEHLEQIRYLGYALDDEEYDPGVRCIAVPIFDHRNQVVGSLGISGPTLRMTQEKVPEFISTLIDLGLEVSKCIRLENV